MQITKELLCGTGEEGGPHADGASGTKLYTAYNSSEIVHALGCGKRARAAGAIPVGVEPLGARQGGSHEHQANPGSTSRLS
jgi:hypothetical protein